MISSYSETIFLIVIFIFIFIGIAIILINLQKSSKFLNKIFNLQDQLLIISYNYFIKMVHGTYAFFIKMIANACHSLCNKIETAENDIIYLIQEHEDLQHKLDVHDFTISSHILPSESSRSGYVYIMESMSYEYSHLLKVGLTNDPFRRENDLCGTPTAMNEDVKMLAYFLCDDMNHTEKNAHRILKSFNRTHGSATEWFEVTFNQARQAIEDAGGQIAQILK